MTKKGENRSRRSQKKHSQVQDESHHKNGEAVEFRDTSLERKTAANRDQTCQYVEQKELPAILRLSVSCLDDVSLSQKYSRIEQAIRFELKKLRLPENEILDISGIGNPDDPSVFNITFKTARVATRLAKVGIIKHEDVQLQDFEVILVSNKSNVHQQRRHSSLWDTASGGEQSQSSNSKEFDEISVIDSVSRSSAPVDQLKRLPLTTSSSEQTNKLTAERSSFGTSSDAINKLERSTQEIGQKFIRAPADQCRKLHISGILSDITDEELELYFESTKYSGGGDVESVERESTKSAVITFAESSVALSVLRRGDHSVNGSKLRLEPYIRPEKGINRKIVVTEMSDGTKTEMLEMYFENKKRSGGGEIEKVEENTDNTVVITFKDDETARRVLEKGQHIIGKVTLNVISFTEKSTKDDATKRPEKASVAGNDDIADSDSASFVNLKTVEIYVDINKVTEEHLQLYLENKKGSGGGDVESMNTKVSPVLVTFVEAADAVEVCSKAVHRCSGVEFRIKQAKPKKADPRYILVCNLNPLSTEDSIKNYVGNVCGQDVEEICLQHDRTVARIALGEPPDWNRITETIKRKARLGELDKFKVQLKPMPICDSIIITNFAKTTTEDGILYKLEHPSIGGPDCVQSVEIKQDSKYAIVHFENPKVVPKILKKDITLDKSKWKLLPYSKCFLSDEIEKLMKSEEKYVKIKVEVEIMDYIQTSKKHNYFLTNIIPKKAVLPKLDQDGTYFILVGETSREPFEEFYRQFDKLVIIIDKVDLQKLHQEIERELKQLQISVDRYTVNVSNERIIVAGQKQCVRTVHENLSQKLCELKEEHIKKQEQKEQIPLPSDKIHLLENSNCLNDVKQQYKVQLEVKKEGILITGEDNKIEKAKLFILMKLLNVASRSMKVSKGSYDLLKTKGGLDRAHGYLKHRNLNSVLAIKQNQNEISITALSSDEADRAISALQPAIHDKKIPLDDGTRELIQSDKGCNFLRELKECYHVLVQQLDSSPSNLVIVGIDISEPEEILLKFLEQNTVRRKFITIKMGLIRFIFDYCRNQLKDIELSLKNCLVTIQQSNGAILIKGTESGLTDAVKRVEKVYSPVKREIFISQRPGVRKLFQRAFIKDVLLSMGNELSLVIISEADDTEKAVIEEGPLIKQKPQDAVGQTGCLCRFKTKAGKIISVYQGDITKHRVDIIVNPANANLRLLGGVAGEILSAGGNIIQDECDEYISEHGDLADGEVAITGAGKIECKKIIHAVGPHWREATNYIGQRELYNRQDTAKKALKMAINNTLIAARQYSSLAIPAVSSGIFGFPKPLCADILVSTVIEFCNKEVGCNLNEINFINNDTPTVKVFEQEFERKFKSQPGFTTFEHAEVKVDYTKQKRRRDFGTEKHVESRMKTKQSNVSESTEKKSVLSSSGNMADTGSLSTPEGIAIKLVVGDLSKQKVDVIVNTASSQLDLASNPCAVAMSVAAGPTLQAECTKVVAGGALSNWNFAKTKSGNLNCQFVYHAVCGSYDKGAGQSEKDLGVMVEKLLSRASKDNMNSIAFPALGTGTLGFPRETVAQIMLDSVFKFSKSEPNTKLEKIHFVAYNLDMQTVTAFQKEFTSRNNSVKSSATASQAIGSGEGDSQHRVRRGAKKPLNTDVLLSDDTTRDTGCISLDSLSVELFKGDITNETTNAIVVIGNEDLDFGGAIGEAIIRKEGTSLKEQAREGGRQKRGTTKFIKTKHIPAKYIAHLVPMSITPSYKDLLKSTSQMLHDAENKELNSISIPAIGSGVLGFTPQASASIILQSIAKLKMSTKDQSQSFLSKIRIVIFEGHMLETFREELMKILNSPESYLENSEDGISIIQWLKDLGKKVISFIHPGPPNPTNSQTVLDRQLVNTNRYSVAKDFDDVTLNIYSTDQRKIQQAKKRIEKMVDENITPVSTKKVAFAKLSVTQKRNIEEKARQSDVSITFDADGTITVVGFHTDTSSIMEYCHDVVLEKVEEDSQIQKGNLMAEIVQWVEVYENKCKVDFDSDTNMKIEEAHNNGEKRIKLELLDENDKEYTCDLDLRAMTGKAGNGSSFKLERVKKAGGISLPESWETMPKDASGKEQPYHVVKLPPQSTEYQAVQKKVLDLSQGQVKCVIEIRQIQNPQLYKSFMARKETMDVTRQNGSGERELFHGTKEAACENINHHGLNRSLAGVNGTVYGVGVYFAVDSAYSARYAQPARPSGPRFMYLAKVLTGEFALGNSSYKTAPRKVGKGGSSTDAYDTVVDNMTNPRIFVTFFDNQCYPEYLIVFT